MNEVVKEFIAKRDFLSDKEPKMDFPSEELTAFVSQYHEYLYSYVYKRKSEAELNSDNKNPLAFFYRGVSNRIHPITSGIYRSNERHEENYYFNEISVRCPDAFRTLNNLEKLTYMQRYGCPTRLLDITSNPLVALYFACLGNKDKDGIVYIFSVNANEVLYSDSDRIQMLSKLTEFRKRDQEQLRLLRSIKTQAHYPSGSSEARISSRLLRQQNHRLDMARYDRKYVIPACPLLITGQ